MNAFWISMLAGVFRAILATAGGYAVAKGTLTEESVTQLSGVVASAGAAALSMWSKFKAARR